MQLVSTFLKTLEENFEPFNDESGFSTAIIEKAFYETNQLFLTQEKINDEDILDLLDACREFIPKIIFTEHTEYQQLWDRLEIALLWTQQGFR